MAVSLRSSLAVFAPLAVSFAVLLGVNLLPPDTALEEIETAGRLTVCAPPELGPLVAQDAERPGFEIALVEEAAKRSGWTVSITHNAAMAREFNPRNWRISRATCRLIVGGLRDNNWSRSLMEMSEPYLESAWVWVAPQGSEWPPSQIRFHPGIFAMDRVTLGTFLRGEGVRINPVQRPEQLLKDIEGDDWMTAITDSITADYLFADTRLEANLLPGGPAPQGISLGFWKGDTTLRRHMDGILAAMHEDGTVERLAEEYGLTESLFR